MNKIKMSISSIEKMIFGMYLFFLPFYNFNSIFHNYIYSIGDSVSFIFHLVGLIFIIIQLKRIKIKFGVLFKYTLIMIFFIDILSLGMAIILNSHVGEWMERNTYIAVFPYIIYSIQILTIIIYNIYTFKKFGFSYVDKVINKTVNFIIIFGYIQILIILTSNPLICKIYDSLNIFDLLQDSETLISWSRITLTTYEPSLAGAVLGILIIPYILAKYISKKNSKYLVCLILILPIVYFTKSSTAYIIFLVDIIVLIIINLKSKKIMKYFVYTSYIGVLITLISLLFINNTANSIENNKILSQINYLVFDKVNDNENLSTIHRKTITNNNIEIFKKYPILGVGTGNQGFFYSENFPEWGYKSYESINTLNGEGSFVGPGPFLLGFLSSHGIFGIIMIIIYLIIILNYLKIMKSNNEIMYIYYILAMGAFIFTSIISINIFVVYFIIFIFSIPYYFGDKFHNAKIQEN